jgi:phosphohistidine phosphatase
MKRLLLVRHAKSSWKNPGLRDYDRPLNSRGKHNAPMMGKRLLSTGILPDVIVSSPAKRAKKTAQLIASVIGFNPKEIVFNQEIYEAGHSKLLKIIRDFDDDWQNIMMIGHNPGFTDLAEALTGETYDNLPTCAICCIEFDIETWADVRVREGHIYYYDYPKSIFVDSNN